MGLIRRIARYLGIAILVVLFLIGAALVTTQTGWFKNYIRGVVVRQAAQFLNGTLSIEHLRGTVLTGIEMDNVALVHEGEAAVVMDRLIVEYDPVAMIRQGLVIKSLTLDRPRVLLQRDNAGWNFNRFVKTRKNTGGKGTPRLIIVTLTVNDGHVVVKDHGAVLEDITGLNSRLRLTYLKPGVEFDIAQLSGYSPQINIKRLAGNLRFQSGATQVDHLSVLTDRSSFTTTFGWSGGTGPMSGRMFDVDLHADRLSLPEVSLLFKPVGGINLAPRLDVKAHGPFSALRMDVAVVSTEGNASGPLIGHFGIPHSGLEGTLDVQHVDLQHLVNRPVWKTMLTGRAVFDWTFGRPTAVGTGDPLRVTFTFTGPEVEGFGYRAENVRAQGVYDAPNLKFDAVGVGYGAAATTRATFHFPATGPMTYTLAGTFRNVDMRRLPAILAMPKLNTVAAGDYQVVSNGTDWLGTGTLDESTVEGGRFGRGTTFALGSTGGVLHYASTGTVADLDPQRVALPLDVTWLADDRFRGLLTGSFTFEGSGRTVDSLVLSTTADLTDSTMAGAGFSRAHVTMEMRDRTLSSTFAGAFERLPASLFTTAPALADSMLNGSADMRITLSLPEVDPTKLVALQGTAAITPSTISGIAIETGEVDLSYANDVAQVRQLALTGPGLSATAKGTLALGDTGRSDFQYDVAVTDLAPLGKRFNRPLTGAAHLEGQGTGPASELTFNGSVDANRFAYGTTLDALTAKSTYKATLPNMDVEQARIQADTTATFVTLAGENLPRVSIKTTYADHELTFDSSLEQDTRSLAAGGRVLIHPDHSEVHLQALNLKVGETQWALAPTTEATLHYSSSAVSVEHFVLQRGAEQVTAEGTVAIGSASQQLANNLSVRLENVQVRDINDLVLGRRPLDGVINATAEIRGTSGDPIVQANFAVTGGNVQGVSFESLSGKAGYQGKAVNLDIRLQQNPAAFLTAVGTVPVPNGPGGRAGTDVIDLAVKSSPIDLALFQAATTQLSNLSGQMEADVHVAGTLDAPALDGRLNLTNAGFKVQSTAVTYSSGLARLSFEGERVLVDRFEVSDDDGDKLVAIGDLGIVRHSVGPMNVQLSAAQFKVLDNAFGHVEVDADFRVTGDTAKPQISGTLSSRNGRLEVDRLLEQLTMNPYNTVATVATIAETPGAIAGTPVPVAPSAASSISLYREATIDVHVTLPDDLLLRGRDIQTAYSRIGLGNANITVGGDLNIRKAPGGEPDVVGTVSVVRGFYEFQGRRFEVLRDSEIRFTGLRPVDPSLQVGAERLISGVTAIVNIRGTARQPLVTLTSSPPMDEADVLSLIVFNQPINQLGEGERLNLAQRAGSMAAGYIAAPLAESIANALDLDLFEIRPEGGVNGQPSVALGQQFGSRLFVQFKQDFGSADHSELSFEYRINELLRLVSSVAQGAQEAHRTQRVDTTGADLIFVLSY
jgi:autotransporter translocation and assembly factor TamB